jgi:hypothetical protein
VAQKFQPWDVGHRVRFAHQRQGEAAYKITRAFWSHGEPFVEIDALPGEYASHVFVAVDYPDDSIVARPKR